MKPSRPAADPSDVWIVATGGAIQIGGQLTQGVVAFAFVAVVVRLLGTDDYGLFRQVAQILAIAAQLGLLGFNYAAMRFIAKARASDDPAGVRGAAWTAGVGALAASGVVFVAVQLGADAIAERFADRAASGRELADLLRLGAGFVPLFALTQVLRYCMQAYKTMVPSVIVGNIAQPLLRLCAAISLIAFGFGVRGAVAGMVIASGLALGLAFALFGRMITPAERETPMRARPGPLVRFALLQGGSSLLGVQTLGLGVLLLGIYGTDRDVGLLGIALALQTPGTLFLGGIVNIWAPVVTDLYERGEMQRLQSMYRTITRWVVTFSFPVFVALIAFPDLFVDLLAGERGEGAAPLVGILAIGNLLYTGTGPTGFVLSMTGRPGINFVNSVGAVALYVVLGVWIVPTHGAVGMVFVDAVVTALVNTARVIEARLIVGIHPFGRSLFKPLGAVVAGMAVAAIVFVALPVAVASVTAITAGAMTYVVVLWRVGLEGEERQVWDGLVRRLALLRHADK